MMASVSGFKRQLSKSYVAVLQMSRPAKEENKIKEIKLKKSAKGMV